MSKVKFYALVCRNMKAVVRHERTIPKEDLAIVINSTNPEFVEEAKEYCETSGIEYYITESNDGPSMGKNSVLDIFEASDNDYMVLVDGDDFLTPHGYWTYKELAKTPNAPDVVALEYQYGIYREDGYHWSVGGLTDAGERSATLGVSDVNNPDKVHGFGTRVFFNHKAWWDNALKGNIITHIEGDEHSKAFSDIHQRWANHCYKYISNWESHLRLVFFSKKAVQGNRYDLNFHIGEDTLFYLQLKKQSIDGNIVMKHLFDRYATYVYDTRIGGLVFQEKDAYGLPGTHDYGWFLWLKKLVEEYDKYEEAGIMSEETPERLSVKTYEWKDPEWYEGKYENVEYDIEWPEDYRPDTMGLVNYPSTSKVYF